MEILMEPRGGCLLLNRCWCKSSDAVNSREVLGRQAPDQALRQLQAKLAKNLRRMQQLSNLLETAGFTQRSVH